MAKLIVCIGDLKHIRYAVLEFDRNLNACCKPANI